MLLAVVFVCIWLESFANGLQILSQSRPIRVVNGTRVTDTQLEVSCFPQDMDADVSFQLQTDSGDTRSVIIRCVSPRRVFRVTYRGVIPSDGELYSSPTACASVSSYNVTLAAPDPITRRTRVLLSHNSRHGDRSPSRFPRVRQDELERLCRQWAPSSKLPEEEFVDTCLNGGQNLDVLSTLNSSAEDAVANLRRYADGRRDLSKNNTALLALLGEAQDVFLNFTDLINRRIKNLINITLLTESKMNDTIAFTTASNRDHILQVSGYETQLSNLSNLIAASANTTDLDFERSFAAVSAVYADQTRTFRELQEIRLGDKSRFFEQIRAAQLAFMDLLTDFDKVYRDEDMLNAHNAKVQKALTEYASTPNPRGRLLKPFLRDAGVKPAADRYKLPPSDASVAFAVDVMRYVWQDTGGTPYGVVTRLAFACDSVWLVETDPVGPSYSDFFDWIGPPGCDSTWVSKSPRCKCVIKAYESRCRMSPLTVSLWFQHNSTSQMGSSVGCIDQPAAYTLDGFVADSADSVKQLIRQLGRRVLAATTENGYRFVSSYARMEATIPYFAGVANLTTITEFMNPGPETNNGKNLVYFYFRTLEISYRAWRDNMQHYRDLVFGRLPAGLSSDQSPWERTDGGGDTGRCTWVEFMLFSNELLTVSDLLHDYDETEVLVTVDGAATRFTKTRDQNPYSNLLPGSATIAWAPTLLNERAWDTPDDDMEICGFRPACKGKLTYVMMPRPELFTLSAWEALNGNREISHQHASNTANLYEVTIDSNASSPTYGRCLTYPLAPGGGWCILRDHYQILANGIFDDPDTPGTMVFIDRDATYTGLITVPSGTYSTTLSSACPTVGKAVAHIGNLITIPLSNSQPNDVETRVTQVGACKEAKTERVPAGRTIELQRVACLLAPRGQPDTLRFEVRVAGDNKFKPCPSTVELIRTNFTEERERFRGAASLALASSWNQASNNVTNLYFMRVASQLSQLLLLSTVQSMRAKINMGYVVSNITMSGYTTLIQRARDISNQARQLAQDGIARSNNLTAARVDTTSLRDQLAAREAQLVAQTNAVIADLNSKSEAASIQVEAVKLLGEKVGKELFRNWVNGQAGFMNAIFEAINRTISDCDPRNGNSTCWDLLGKTIVELGNLDPERAKCVPSGLVALFGSSSSTSAVFGELLGGCANGNNLGPFVVLALVAFGSMAILLFSFLYLKPAWNRYSMRYRGTRSTTASDSNELVEADKAFTSVQREYEELLKTKGSRVASLARYSDSRA